MSLQVPLNLTQTNGHYSFTVPAYGYQNVINIDMAGAGGGAGGRYYGSNGAGGNGARINGSFNVSPGDQIDVYIGDSGKAGTVQGTNSAGGAGGYGAVIGDSVGSGQLYPVTLSWAWSQWMNAYAVWVNPDEVNPVGQWVTVTRSVYFPAGLYRFYTEADNLMNVYVDGNLLYSTPDDHTFDIYQNGVEPTGYLQISDGLHIMQFDVYNEGGPAGFAFQWQNEAIPNSVHWSTRTDLNGNNSYRYNFSGGRGGNTYGDGGYVYPAPGGGGGATSVFVNGNLVLVAGGGGGGGSEGGHGAGGTPGGDGGTGGGSPLIGQGQPGSDGSDIAGTPGGGGGYNGGAAGSFVYYDDAPSLGANGGTNYNGFNVTYTSGNGIYTVPNGVTQLTVTVIGGGGGGGGCGDNEEPLYTGGGGAGGDTVSQIINVTPGQQIAWTVGTGGSGGGVGYAGYAGLPTVFGGLVAGGGYGGGIPYGANNGVYVTDEYSASGGAGGAPNGGAGGAYDEDAEVGYSGQNGSSGSISIQIGSWSYSTYAGSGTLGDGLPGFCNFTLSRLGAGSVKVNNNWKFISENYVKVNNAWKVVAGSWVKVNGSWKLISSSGAPSVSFIPA
jgi:hypothetical protein